MKNYCDRLGFLTGLTVILLAAQTTLAAEQKIKAVQLEQNGNEVELKLGTQGKPNDAASFFTVRRGNLIEANLLNTELELPQGDSFRQANPLPGINTVEIHRVDGDHTQITVDLEQDAAIDHLLQQQGQEIVLNLSRPTLKESIANGIKDLSQKAVQNIKQTYKSSIATETKGNDKLDNSAIEYNSPDSDVLIPKPEVEISANETKIQQSLQAASRPQTNLPRAVAPPVGDMSVSNIDASPDEVDLGSGAVVPRLVLRDAPVREVLSLLARSAGLNVVFAAGEEDRDDEESGPIVSLDLENQPVQEVFNSVLLVSGLNANRKGNIVYVGKELPAQARNLVSRTLRLNQVSAENAALYLASQGASGKRLTTEVEETIDPDTGRVVQRVESSAELSDLDGGNGGDDGTSPLLLKGLQVSTDSRLNSITLVGEPRKVETATAFLTQLDARRRQVAVNVKVIDVNLLNQDVFNSSFSFGVNDSFFVQDNGSAALRFGETSPVRSTDLSSDTGRLSNPPIIVNPYVGAETFLDLDSTTTLPGTDPGVIDEETGLFVPGRERGDLDFFGRVAGVSGDPFTAGITDFTRATDGVRTVTRTENADGTVTEEVTFTQGTEGTATSALPSLFRYPDKFLALLESKITSGNAKILTDPTLMVQEGQQATVKLAQNIVESVKTDIDGETGTRTITPVIAEAGVVLTVNVEQIDDNGFVSLSVSPTVSSIGATQNFDSGGGAVNLLNLLSKRELSSGLVRMRDGQTLILSGIIQDQERTTISKVPILGDIPLLGSLFRSSDNANERAEVIVLLTPEVVEEDAGMGNNFNPSQESREMLKKQGVALPQN